MSLYQQVYFDCIDNGCSPDVAEQEAYWFIREVFEVLDGEYQAPTDEERCESLQELLMAG